ncbi:MAG: hypothetical protein CMP47_03010 [Rickettsiales bacterium]|nr:hypothetical protein [Rickettsiales bacterium]
MLGVGIPRTLGLCSMGDDTQAGPIFPANSVGADCGVYHVPEVSKVGWLLILPCVLVWSIELQG